MSKPSMPMESYEFSSPTTDPASLDSEMDAIFEGFYRSDRTADKATGHGLGLTVCKRLVETQGGRIWARNLERGGLEVGFAFPTVPVEELVS